MLIAAPWQPPTTLPHVWITGYVWTGDRTFTGVWPSLHHTVAVDPRVIPLHAHLYIDGLYTIYTAEDTGGMVKGLHVDVYSPSVAYANSITGYRTVTWWR